MTNYQRQSTTEHSLLTGCESLKTSLYECPRRGSRECRSSFLRPSCYLRRIITAGHRCSFHLHTSWRTEVENPVEALRCGLATFAPPALIIALLAVVLDVAALVRWRCLSTPFALRDEVMAVERAPADRLAAETTGHGALPSVPASWRDLT